MKLTDPEAFRLEMKNARRVVRDMYGKDNPNASIMDYKLCKCENVEQISNVLAWGRNHLL